VFRVARRFITVAEAAKVRADDRKPLGEYRRNAMPADMSLRVTMQQQDGITASTADEVDGNPLSFDLLMGEASKHGYCLTLSRSLS
jgi:hypothetical protein